MIILVIKGANIKILFDYHKKSIFRRSFKTTPGYGQTLAGHKDPARSFTVPGLSLLFPTLSKYFFTTIIVFMKKTTTFANPI